MISSNHSPKYPVLRAAMCALAVVAITLAVTGVIGGITVLAWVVALIAVATFAASFYLKE